jgi:uncharacterized protein
MSDIQRPVGDFVWYEYMARDVAAARSFYGALFGWSASTEAAFEAGTYTQLSAGPHKFGGMMTQGEELPAKPDWLGYVWVEALEATLSKVAEAGGQIVVPATDIPETGRFAVLADPCGAAVAVFERAAESDDEGLPSESVPGLFCWAELWAHDVDDAKAFYQAVFGWSTDLMEMPGGIEYTVCKIGEVNTAGIMASPVSPDVPAFWLYYVSVADTDATAARAVELGGEVWQGPEDIPGVGRFAILRDPAGAAIGVIAPPAS